MVVEVFKTNVECEPDANKIVALVQEKFPDCEINFDLEDRDKILRIASTEAISHEIISLVYQEGFLCEILPG